MDTGAVTFYGLLFYGDSPRRANLDTAGLTIAQVAVKSRVFVGKDGVVGAEFQASLVPYETFPGCSWVNGG